jgi:hypothetical protein
VALARLLEELGPAESYHHGGAAGADGGFHELVRWRSGYVVLHPCTPGKDQAGCVGDETRPHRPPLLRNQAIVDETDLLIACPARMEEQGRGGTWATVRYARRQGKAIVFCWRDGTDSREGPVNERAELR